MTNRVADCDCGQQPRDDRQRRVLWIALVLNAAMAVIGATAGWLAQSTGLLADALDMLTDASSYAIGILAIGRSIRFKTNAANFTGVVLLVLGAGILFEVVRRIRFGAEPLSLWMVSAALLSLSVNVSVLYLLTPYKSGEVHLRATWICTRADVLANLGVILAGVLVWLTGSPYPDFLVGTAIGLYVIKEALEILSDARRTGREVRA